ncbi:MAG: DNA-formamidopyrimidine glycosylase family protein [Gemmatimonadota bacterium]
MPELPDITVYLEALAPRVLDHPLLGLRITSPFVLRSVEPAPSELVGRRVTRLDRMGKRIVFGFEGELFLVLHLMIAGRLKWLEPAAPVPRKVGLAAWDFAHGTLVLTEAGARRRASIYLVRGEQALEDHARGGLEVLESSLAEFTEALKRENHTLKRSLTDPRLFSGIGNAYSDEILHRARLSPVRLTRQLTDPEIATLHRATRDVLTEWIDRLRRETGGGFPAKVTAFREGMAVHGRFGKPCPVCDAPVQRIRYASNETNYCATCQTGGRLLADRSLSRLLKEDWPRSLEEMDELRRK